MTIRVFTGPLLCVLLLMSAPALAVDGNPVTGIGVGVESNPGGIIIAAGSTNSNGLYTFRNLPPGTYVLRITSGDRKGTVLKTITVKKAGPVSGKVVTKGSGVAEAPAQSKSK